jgi:phage terminase small subunit
MRNLSGKQQVFVDEYLKDLNATQAAIRAGYSKKTAEDIGRQALRKAPVAAAIQKVMDERSKRTKITADYVLNGIKNTIERCAQEEPVRDQEGNETGEYKFEANAVLKGYELLGKHLKLFTDKVEHSQDQPFVVEIVQFERPKTPK